MKLKHDENELTKPLEEDQRIVEVASFIGVFRNWFKDENIEAFFEYWNWCHENGINSVTRDESENAHFLEKKDKQLALDKYKWSELRLTNEFNDFYKYLNTELLPQYVRRVPHVYHPVAHEGKIQQTLPGEGYHLWHCEWDADYSKRVLAYAKKRPDRLEYVMKRYPKNDPRLSMLNYKMDRMTEANDKYLETQFPTNQDLFTKVKDRTKKNMNLTDPKNFKPVKDPIKYVDVKNTKKLKETVTRHFNKPVKSKSMFGLSISKVRKTNQKMIEKRVKEQQIKDDEKAYINEKMSRQKSNWKDDLTEV